MAINRLFGISSRSLGVYQKALAVTSNNIANSSNPDYSRQRVIFGSSPAEYQTRIAFGSGVTIDDVRRVKNQITDNQIWKYNQSNSSSSKHSQILSSVESLFQEPSEYGLSNILNSFFNSWNKLSVNPTSVPVRMNVLQSAQKLSNKINTLYNGMLQVKSDTKAEAGDVVKTLNSTLSELQEVNKQIYSIGVNVKAPNTLLDTRDKLINELSKYANINVTYEKDNTVNVSVGGLFAVDRLNRTEFKVNENSAGQLNIQTSDGATNMSLTGGSLNAITTVYNQDIPDYLKQLDTVTNTIYNQVNSLHSKGYTITNPQQTGINFFSSYSDGKLVINKDIVNNVNNIAVSSDGSEGNNDIALQIASLKDTKLINGLTVLQSYSNLVSQVGNDKKTSDEKTQTTQLVLNQLQNQKAATSGVSIDEEMINVLKYQRAYDASAKLIKVADEILQTLLQMV